MTRHIFIAFAALAMMSAAACGNRTQGAGTDQAADDAEVDTAEPADVQKPAAPAFIAQASATDLFELQEAALVEARSANAAVRALARTMALEHTKSAAGLKTAIAESGQTFALVTVLPPDLQGRVDDLQKSEAKDFDATYIDDQVNVHQDALSVIQPYAKDGDVPAIKKFAARLAPTEQRHLDTAKKIQDAMN